MRYKCPSPSQDQGVKRKVGNAFPEVYVQACAYSLRLPSTRLCLQVQAAWSPGARLCGWTWLNAWASLFPGQLQAWAWAALALAVVEA